MHNKSVTGHDGYIIAKALAYAVAHIQSLPAENQEFGDMCDMLDVLRAQPDAVVKMAVSSAEHHTGRTINLAPESQTLAA